MRSVRSAAGFTLLETMVALMLAGMVTWLAHVTVTTAVDVGRRADAHLSEVRKAASVRAQLHAWLVSARLDAESGDVFAATDGRTASGMPDDRLEFMTMRPAPDRTIPARLVIEMDEDPATGEHGLLATVHYVGEPTSTKLVLAAGAAGFQARYLFRNGTDATWYRGWNSTASLPSAVELLLIGDDLPPLLRVPVTVPLEWP